MTADEKRKIIGIIGLNKIIPVIIDDVRYNIGKSQITMMCKPYTPQPFSEIFYNITEISHVDKLDNVLLKLKSEESLHDKIKNTKLYLGFKTLIYPYKTARKFEQSHIGAKFKETNIKEILNNKNVGCITTVDYSTDNYILISDTQITPETPVSSVNVAFTTALSEILLNKLHYLQTLRGFVEHYDTPEKNQEMLAYWKACAGLKE